MNLPTYKDIMVPALQLLSATDVIRKRDITAPLAEQLGLTDEARLAEYESGNGNIFEDRTSWALSYLSLSALADKPKRGFYRLSETGRELLQRPERVEAYVAEKLAARDRQRQAEQAEAAPPGIDDSFQDCRSGLTAPAEQVKPFRDRRTFCRQNPVQWLLGRFDTAG